jgi:2-polyprenyl-3-methyl-5-hydroxy-6-metoxy-1,4-benzoquinol methylase
MGCCATTTRVESVFNDKLAACDLRRYRKKGPRRSTRLLLEALKAAGVEGKTLLDIGGGIGAIQHELLDAGAASATSVEASGPYLKVEKDESERRGHDGVDFRHGDFVELAPTVEPADLVTLDRVICCYPDMERLVGLSAARARELYGVVYPRDTRLVRLGFATVNLVLRLLRKPMRAFVHRKHDLEALVQASGLTAHFSTRAGAWQVALYRRKPAPSYRGASSGDLLGLGGLAAPSLQGGPDEQPS